MFRRSRDLRSVSDYEILNRELANYNADLAARPQIVVATKLDALDEPERLKTCGKRPPKTKSVSGDLGRRRKGHERPCRRRRPAAQEIKRNEIKLTEQHDDQDLFELRMNDGSRHFADLPEAVFFDEFADHAESSKASDH
ncbi:MAG: hypothetical protein IPJ30_23115 [Acidobacteria bacterium]|nr:hypothetical protein [Acidobacteriota bacterium]